MDGSQSQRSPSLDPIGDVSESFRLMGEDEIVDLMDQMYPEYPDQLKPLGVNRQAQTFPTGGSIINGGNEHKAPVAYPD